MSDLATRIAALSPEQRELLLRRLGKQTARPDRQRPALQRTPREIGRLPLTFAQQRLWFLEQMTPGNPTYTMAGAARIAGPLDTEALQRSLDALVDRHEVLRSTFPVQEGQPTLAVEPTQLVPMQAVDLREVAPDRREETAQRIMREEARRPFDLTTGPLLRATLIRLADDEHLLLLAMHHIVADGWSTKLLFRDLGAFYQAFSAERPSPLPDLPLQYADIAYWQRTNLTDDTLEPHLRYWRERLAGELPVLELPADRPRPAAQTYAGATRPLTLSADLVEALRQVSKREGATLFMTLLAAFKVLLYRYTAQEDILVGTPIANRTAETEGLVGLFVNTLVLRSDLSGNPRFRELVQQVRSTALDAYAHQEVPFEKLVEEIQPERDLSHSPLFQVLFNLQSDPLEHVKLPGLTLEHVDTGAAKFDLTFDLVEGQDRIGGHVEYNTDLFDAGTIDRLIAHFRTLLQGIARDADQRVSELPLLDTAEQRRLLVEWNDTARELPEGQRIHDLIAAQTARTPNAVAVVHEDRQLTYAALERRSNQLARYLRRLGIGPDARVGLCVERSPEMLVALLAVLKAGGAYTPLDPALPGERLRFMVEDGQIALLLTQQHLVSLFPDLSIPCVRLDSEQEVIARESDEAVDGGASPGSLAYIIYTSGSTGKPKGVMVHHGAVVNFLHSMRRCPGMTQNDTLLSVTTLSFDIAALELLLPLIAGARVVLAGREVVADGVRLGAELERSGATVMQATPATWRMLVEAGWKGKQQLRILCGGEALPRELANELLARGASVWNLFGPTETTIWSTVQHVEEGTAPVSIGRPIDNTEIYILDAARQPVPIGVAGEMYIGGAGVALGYHNRPALTREKFVPHPFRDEPGARLYRTGDLARYRPNGEIEFLGRLDFQVKVRGYRIELGEIETLLDQHPAIRHSVVVAREDRAGDKRLVAYVVGDGEGLSLAELRAYLKESLPEYMVPSAFVLLERLPQTPNGKIDRRALPAPDAARIEVETSFVAPRTELEQTLAASWADLLNVERVGIHDSFFDLGGHSLLATQLIFRIRESLGVEVPLPVLFQTPTVAGMAAAIELIRETGDASALAAPAVDLTAEVELDPTITIAGAIPADLAAEPRAILLTGATGFLGAFLLDELLRETPADVYCLVRAFDAEDAMQRLRQTLRSYGLSDAALASRVIPVVGDLAQPFLGLTSDRFQELARTIDVIYHNGALVNFMYPYTALKAANVLGTQEILRLASQTKVKPVHYVSTFYVFSRYEYEAGDVLLEDDKPRHDLTYTLGYTQSKWVAEQLLEIGRSRGVPIAIYRPGRISGHSQTGACQTNDFVWRCLQAGIQVKSAPMVDMILDMTPIDYVSKALVYLSRQPASLGKAFHLVNPRPIDMDGLSDWMRRFGYQADFVSYDEWCDRVRRLVEQSPDSAALPLMPLLSGSLPIDQLPKVSWDFRNTEDGLAGSGISCPPVDDRLLATYFDYFIRTGFLEGPAGDVSIRAMEETEAQEQERTKRTKRTPMIAYLVRAVAAVLAYAVLLIPGVGNHPGLE